MCNNKDEKKDSNKKIIKRRMTFDHALEPKFDANLNPNTPPPKLIKGKVDKAERITKASNTKSNETEKS